jgi:SAM-dependent methyltransferase/predicted RNA-binding Zn-ribbon protein involved in translation (DUF1610 family)
MNSNPLTIKVVSMPCPLCGSDSFRRLHRVRDFTYGVPGEFFAVRCTGCGHMRLNPRPADDAIMDCYPAVYAPYHGHRTDDKTTGSAAMIPMDASSDDPASGESASGKPASGEPASGEPASRPSGERSDKHAASPPNPGGNRLRRSLRRIPLLKRFLIWIGQDLATVLPDPPRPAESWMLEIGCADGWFLKRAADRGWQVRGIEPSPEAAQRGRERGFDVRCGMFAEIPLEDESFDAVASWMVLEHVADPQHFVETVYRILRTGGSFSFSVPNGGGWERRVFGRYWLGYDAPRHLQIFTPRTLRRLLHRVGFVDVQIIHQPNTRYWYGSLAAWGIERLPSRKWPSRWLDYFWNDPPGPFAAMLLPAGRLMAALRLSGRLTVVARKPGETTPANRDA